MGLHVTVIDSKNVVHTCQCFKPRCTGSCGAFAIQSNPNPVPPHHDVSQRLSEVSIVQVFGRHQTRPACRIDEIVESDHPVHGVSDIGRTASVCGRDRLIVLVEAEGNKLGVLVELHPEQRSMVKKEAVELGSDNIPRRIIAS